MMMDCALCSLWNMECSICGVNKKSKGSADKGVGSGICVDVCEVVKDRGDEGGCFKVVGGCCVEGEEVGWAEIGVI